MVELDQASNFSELTVSWVGAGDRRAELDPVDAYDG